jgi:hypothetical protein
MLGCAFLLRHGFLCGTNEGSEIFLPRGCFFSFYFYNTKDKKMNTDFFCILCPSRKQRRDMGDFVVSDKDFIFVVSSNRYRKTNRAETFEFDKVNGLGVCVSWHEDKNDDEGERVDFTTDFDDVFGHTLHYHVPVRALIRVVLCVPPIARQQERDVATAMLLHGRLGSSCALSHLDDITKDALLCTIVGHLHKTTLTVVYKQESYDEEPDDAVALKPTEPYELPWPLQFNKANDTPCSWIVRDADKKTVLELKFSTLKDVAFDRNAEA